jgi:phenylacetate-CoA ligase
VVSRPGAMDHVVLRAEPVAELGKEKAAELAQSLSTRIKVKTNLTFQVDIVPRGTLPRYTLKARRFKDLREKQ